jgi:hypothetical protein
VTAERGRPPGRDGGARVPGARGPRRLPTEGPGSPGPRGPGEGAGSPSPRGPAGLAPAEGPGPRGPAGLALAEGPGPRGPAGLALAEGPAPRGPVGLVSAEGSGPRGPAGLVPADPGSALGGATPTSRGPRRLARPRLVRVRADAGGRPEAVAGRAVEAVRESWLIEDRWWTDAPLRRRYWEVVTADGRDLVVFRDLDEGRWYAQR